MDILVVGGTGFIGSYLSEALVDRGHSVVTLSRNPDNDSVSDEIQHRMGDVTSYESIASAFEGIDVAINLVALSPLFKPKGGDDAHFDVHLNGTKNIVQAAEDHDISCLVQMSGLGADPNGKTAYLQAKGKAEEVVKDSDIEWVIFRPSVVFGDGGEFTEFTKLLTTPYVTGLPSGGSMQFQPIWVQDLVEMMATAVEENEYWNEIYEIGGPEVLTLAQVTKLVYQAEGKSVSILPIPKPFAKVGLTFADKIPGIPLGKDQYRALDIDNTVTDNDINAFDVTESDLKTYREYLNLKG